MTGAHAKPRVRPWTFLAAVFAYVRDVGSLAESRDRAVRATQDLATTRGLLAAAIDDKVTLQRHYEAQARELRKLRAEHDERSALLRTLLEIDELPEVDA